MMTTLTTGTGALAYDDSGATGPPVLLLPGAGDVMTEHRLLRPALAAAGYRTVTMDLRGHGASDAHWDSFGVVETAGDIVAMLRHVDAGPAVVVATSFAPAAALTAAVDEPDLIRGVVAISPHLDQDAGVTQRLGLQVLLRGPWAGAVWSKLYRSWYKEHPPQDLEEQIGLLRGMLAESDRRRAVRETLLAHRRGLHAKLADLNIPVLNIFGGADDHFADPEAAAKDAAHRTKGRYEIVAGAGHYPHVERPELVGRLITGFLGGL